MSYWIPTSCSMTGTEWVNVKCPKLALIIQYHTAGHTVDVTGLIYC